MTRLIVLLISSAALLSAADISGNWVGKSVPTNDGFAGPVATGVTLNITQTGSEFGGVFSQPEFKPAKVEAGHIEDGKITFWLRNSRNVLITAQLRVSGEWLVGRMTSSAGQVTNVALKKQQDKGSN